VPALCCAHPGRDAQDEYGGRGGVGKVARVVPACAQTAVKVMASALAAEAAFAILQVRRRFGVAWGRGGATVAV